MNQIEPATGTPISNLFVVVEDHYLREKIAGILSRLPGALMVSQTDDCAKAAQAAARCCPDAVFVCLRQAAAGAVALRQLRAACSRVRIFAVADCPECAALAAPAALGVDAVFEMATLLTDLDRARMNLTPGTCVNPRRLPVRCQARPHNKQKP